MRSSRGIESSGRFLAAHPQRLGAAIVNDRLRDSVPSQNGLTLTRYARLLPALSIHELKQLARERGQER